jgi:hypothetical protein
MTRTVQATAYCEIALTVTATYVPGHGESPPTYSHGGLPAEPDGFEDVELVGLSVLTRRYDREAGAFVNTPVDLLDGVEITVSSAKRLVANLLAALSDEVDQALADEISE